MRVIDSDPMENGVGLGHDEMMGEGRKEVMGAGAKVRAFLYSSARA